jgi:uracil-DNA glycosylase
MAGRAASSFEVLVRRVSRCRRCEGMAYSHVLGETNGRLDAGVLVVGEAPGRLGAARTGVPFSGDRSGERLELLLGEAGLSREDVFITNAVLCNPLSTPVDGEQRNRRPRVSEARACQPFLEATLRFVPASIVVALGGAALEALGRIEPHSIESVVREAGVARAWGGRTLAPLVHPSPRTQGQRSWPEQVGDWRAVGELARSSRV